MMQTILTPYDYLILNVSIFRCPKLRDMRLGVLLRPKVYFILQNHLCQRQPTAK